MSNLENAKQEILLANNVTAASRIRYPGASGTQTS